MCIRDRSNSLTDVELYKSLTKDGLNLPEDKFNKLLLDLEILGLIKVAWFTKDERRIEVALIEKEEDPIEKQNKEVIDESYLHNVEPGRESHVRIVAISEVFEGLNLVKRHQLIYAEIQEEIDGPIHALSIHTFTEQEWKERNEKAEASPDCLGGSKNDI